MVGACSDTSKPVEPGDETPAAAAARQDPLPGWFRKASPVVLALPGTVFADHDEANNRLLFGVENAAAIFGVRTALEHLGIPSSAYSIEVTEPIHALATLRDRWRPTQAGVQIHFGQFLCSLGFNANDGTEASMITASHCTNRQGGVEGTTYFQPLSSTDPTVIATEVEDPEYFRGGACPRGRKCRSSDASRAKYSTGITGNHVIAKTSGPNNGSLVVTGSFTVASQDNTTTSFTVRKTSGGQIQSLGEILNKVGRTTGWTQGDVTQTCVDTNVASSNITLLCQTFVENANGAVVVGGGDSGSGIFRITGSSSAELVGILWGGNSGGTLFVFSPLKQIRDELGQITAN
jgi:hypothetical protein